MVYSQIWLNLPTDDCHFSNIFLWDDHQLGYSTKSLKKNTNLTTLKYVQRPSKKKVDKKKMIPFHWSSIMNGLGGNIYLSDILLQSFMFMTHTHIYGEELTPYLFR